MAKAFKIKYGLLWLLLLVHTVVVSAQLSLADSIIQQQSLRQSVMYLSGDNLKGRLTGSAGADSAAAFIAAQFKMAGLDTLPANKGYFENYVAYFEGKKIPAKNVVAVLPAKFSTDSLVIFSAHYDHVGQGNDMPDYKAYSRQDDIFNGANDNATGVAALIELAKFYKAQNSNRYNILFVAFSGEEMGLLGSGYLSKQINLRLVKAMINLEMLGRPAYNNCYVISFSNKSIKNALNSCLKKYQPNDAATFFSIDPYPAEDLVHRSDHYPFTQKVKRAFTIMASSPSDMYYHTVDDEYETIDFDFLLEATRNIALACGQFTR